MSSQLLEILRALLERIRKVDDLPERVEKLESKAFVLTNMPGLAITDEEISEVCDRLERLELVSKKKSLQPPNAEMQYFKGCLPETSGVYWFRNGPRESWVCVEYLKENKIICFHGEKNKLASDIVSSMSMFVEARKPDIPTSRKIVDTNQLHEWTNDELASHPPDS